MRVLQIVDDLPRVPRGGLDRHVAELNTALRERDIDSIVLKLAEGEGERVARLNAAYEKDRKAGEAATAAAIESARTQPVTVAWGDPSDGSGGLRQSISNRPLLDAFAEALERLRPQVVHIHTMQHLSHRVPEVARRFGAEVVWTMHDFFAVCARTHLTTGQGIACGGPQGGLACGPCYGGFKGFFAAPVFVLRHVGFLNAFRLAHAIVVPSRFARDILVEQGAPADSVHVLPPAVPREARMADLPAGTQARFVFAGDLRRSKGADLAIEALSLLPPGSASLDVYGGSPAPPAPAETPFEADLRAAAVGLPVRFHGRYGDGDLMALLDGATGLLVPSRVRETFGRTANRALQGGVPVIAARHGALPEFVHEGVNGALCEPDDAEDLAAAMRRVMEAGLGMQAEAEHWPPAPDLADHLDGLLPLYRWSP